MRLYTIESDTQAASCGGTRLADSVRSALLFRGLLVTHPFFGDLRRAAADRFLVTQPARVPGDSVLHRLVCRPSKPLPAAEIAIASVSSFLYPHYIGGSAMNTPHSSQPGKPRLLDQVRETIRVKHYSPKTEDAYVGWIRRYILFHGKRHPSEMGADQVAQFLSHLALKRHVAASTQNQAFHALLFLYRQVLHIELGEVVDAVRAKKPKRLPVVLTREEVDSVLALLDGEVWLVCSLLYGAGLRLFEALQLRVKDIDFSRSELLLRDGKGQKDRITMLPTKVQSALRQHLEMVRRQHDSDLAQG